MIGTSLKRALEGFDYRVYGLSRTDSQKPFYYDEQTEKVRLDPSIPLHGVINLAGANISTKRWSPARKREIIDSRQKLTSALCAALADTEPKPEVLLSASAIGYYGDTGSDQVDEQSPAGYDFLARVASVWEQATAAAENAGIRTVHLRFGIVLSPEGGVLKELLLPFKLGLGGKIGHGGQKMSWISLDDAVGIVVECLRARQFSGAINVVSNNQVDNAEFTRSLGKVLHRWTISPFLIAPVVTLMLGEMGDALLLGSSSVSSTRLEEVGYQLKHPTLQSAFQSLL